MQTRLIIIHELNPQPARSTPAHRPALSRRDAAQSRIASLGKNGKLAKPPRPHDSTATTGDSGRLVFVNWLPGRWIRCTGGMLAAALLLDGGAIVRADAGTSFHAANSAFSQDKYPEAERGYESILAEKGFSAPVLYNLANAQFRDGKLGSAVLNYERALVLAPNDPDIAANLKLARTRTAGTANAPVPGLRLTHLLTLDAWAGVAAAAMFIAGAAVVLQRLLRRGRIATRITGIIAALVSVTALSVLTLRWPDLDRAIVIARECPLRISPTSIGEQLFPLHEGDAVTLQRMRGEFASIRSQNGRTGWVKRSDLGRVYAVAQK